METTEALTLLRQVAERFQGTLADHQLLQQALQTLEAALQPAPEPAANGQVPLKPDPASVDTA